MPNGAPIVSQGNRVCFIPFNPAPNEYVGAGSLTISQNNTDPSNNWTKTTTDPIGGGIILLTLKIFFFSSAKYSS